MPKQRIGLGRGIDALIPSSSLIADEDIDEAAMAVAPLGEVPIDAITPNPYQPRTQILDDAQLNELATSIKEVGMLQPLILTMDGEDEYGTRYRIIAGERRWRAAQLAGLETVPAIVRESSPQQMLELALIENLQRSDLNPLEEAQGYRMLMDEYSMTQEQIAEGVGRNRATIANKIRLLDLPDEVIFKLRTMPQVFTEGHARAVLQVNGDALRINLADRIVAQGMSVRQAEEEARRYNEAALRLTPDRRGAQVRQQSYETRELEREFTEAIELKARLQRSNQGKGSLTLYFNNDDQLQTLYERIVGAERAQLNGGNGNGYSIRAIESPESLLDDTFDIAFDGGAGGEGNN
jgi:ParB family chromosome partitioning protein